VARSCLTERNPRVERVLKDEDDRERRKLAEIGVDTDAARIGDGDGADDIDLPSCE
jgi:hypothetical protein